MEKNATHSRRTPNPSRKKSITRQRRLHSGILSSGSHVEHQRIERMSQIDIVARPIHQRIERMRQIDIVARPIHRHNSGSRIGSGGGGARGVYHSM